jgi:hypothetical protein
MPLGLDLVGVDVLEELEATVAVWRLEHAAAAFTRRSRGALPLPRFDDLAVAGQVATERNGHSGGVQHFEAVDGLKVDMGFGAVA